MFRHFFRVRSVSDFSQGPDPVISRGPTPDPVNLDYKYEFKGLIPPLSGRTTSGGNLFAASGFSKRLDKGQNLDNLTLVPQRVCK